ncbi:hypothetical protein [Nocardiopsis sp. CNT312]|uniref:hypothetical protein n=1 Tax=Nocardiopsis sp. CNT312 TaxID=1137268 RepID=UPI00055E9DE2|nr:hypothetical protein [Nocardiopsis sp. CNT312]
MSLVFMVFLLVAAVLAIGGGSYAVRRVVASLEERLGPEPAAPPADVADTPPREVGGYVAAQSRAEELPPSLRTRVRALLALGRTEEAVRLVGEYTADDEETARGIVADLDTGRGPGRILEP